jgi:predicted tellurium resistance membrane protein TerC
MEMLLDPAIWASFVTLCVLEIVLGIDNLILISILSDRLPPHRRSMARRVGLIVALATRIALLSLIFVIAQLTDPLFTVMEREISWRSIILIVGGLFLLAKGTMEIHEKMEGSKDESTGKAKYATFHMVIAQIVVMDIVFSFDSVLTAVGIADDLPVMIAAIIVSVLFMLVAVNAVSEFISRHPTVKVLALSYMLLIGMALIGEGMGFHIPKGYLYFAMAFSFGVEAVNMQIRKKARAHSGESSSHP